MALPSDYTMQRKLLKLLMVPAIGIALTLGFTVSASAASASGPEGPPAIGSANPGVCAFQGCGYWKVWMADQYKYGGKLGNNVYYDNMTCNGTESWIAQDLWNTSQHITWCGFAGGGSSMTFGFNAKVCAIALLPVDPLPVPLVPCINYQVRQVVYGDGQLGPEHTYASAPFPG